MEQLNRLIELCNEKNYNFFIHYYDDEFAVSVQDNNVQIDKDIASTGGHYILKDAVIEVLKATDR